MYSKLKFTFDCNGRIQVTPRHDNLTSEIDKHESLHLVLKLYINSMKMSEETFFNRFRDKIICPDEAADDDTTTPYLPQARKTLFWNLIGPYPHFTRLHLSLSRESMVILTL